MYNRNVNNGGIKVNIKADLGGIYVPESCVKEAARSGLCVARENGDRRSLHLRVSPVESFIIEGEKVSGNQDHIIFDKAEYVGPDSLYPTVVKFASFLILTRIREKDMKRVLKEVEERMRNDGADDDNDEHLETTKGIDNLDQGAAGQMRTDGGPKIPHPDSGLPASASKEDPHEGTPEEREAWFKKRTNAHIRRVRKFAKIIEDSDPEKYRGLVEKAKDHDQSKFKEPQRTPYIALTWQHKWDDYKSYKAPGIIPDKAINDATLLHITTEEHHPEYWTNQKDGDLLNSEDRDAAPKEMIDATKMSPLAIAEMVADWAAMSEELGQGSPRRWADKKVNIRWKFTPEQKKQIYDLISLLEKKK